MAHHHEHSNRAAVRVMKDVFLPIMKLRLRIHENNLARTAVSCIGNYCELVLEDLTQLGTNIDESAESDNESRIAQFHILLQVTENRYEFFPKIYVTITRNKNFSHQ